jgi:hypothetical protein
MFLLSGCGQTMTRVQFAERLFEQIELSTTGYGTQRTNVLTFPQCPVIMDLVARAGYFWRYALWYDRSNGAGSPASRLGLASQRCPSSKDPTVAHNWEAPTVFLAPTGLNPTNSASDAHNSISAAVDPAGCLHVVWNAHWDEWQGAYWKNTGPGDISSISVATVKGGSTGNALPAGFPPDWSYGKFMLKQDGLIFTYRIGASGSGSQRLNEYNHATGVWSQVGGELIDFASGSPYMQHVHVNPLTDVVHFSFVVAEGQNTTTYRDYFYFTGERSGGAGSAWTFRSRIGQAAVSLPIDDSATFLAWATGLNRGVQVHQGLSSTEDDVPLIVGYYAKDGVPQDGGSNRYLFTVDGGAWVRKLVHEVHPVWNLVNAAGGGDDPTAPNSEYTQVSGAQVLYAPSTGACHVYYRSNYELGSAGIPPLMVTSSFAFPFDAWTDPQVAVDLPCGDYGPSHDTSAWGAYEHPVFMVSLIDVANQWPGGAASTVWLCDCQVPEA